MKMSNTEDTYTTPCSLPIIHERELLIIFTEECAEAIKEVAKALRFGLKHKWQYEGETLPLTNAHRIGREIGDILEMADRLVGAGIVSDKAITEGRVSKKRQLRKFMQTKGD